jgi:hypothetical protein
LMTYRTSNGLVAATGWKWEVIFTK